MTDESDFTTAAPIFGENSGPGFMPEGGSMAWLQDVIKVKFARSKLPEDVKNELTEAILADMEPYINYASNTRINRWQILEFTLGFDEIWLRYRIFHTDRQYIPELNYIMSYIKEIFVLALNRSVDGWQGNHVFERKTSTDVRLVRTENLQNIKRGFLRRRQPEQQGGKQQ